MQKFYSVQTSYAGLFFRNPNRCRFIDSLRAGLPLGCMSVRKGLIFDRSLLTHAKMRKMRFCARQFQMVQTLRPHQPLSRQKAHHANRPRSFGGGAHSRRRGLGVFGCGNAQRKNSGRGHLIHRSAGTQSAGQRPGRGASRGWTLLALSTGLLLCQCLTISA